MRIAFGISWNDSKRGRVFAAVGLAAALSVSATPNAMQDLSDSVGEMVSVIVRELPGAGTAPEATVERLGGKIGVQIDLIDGFAASVPAESLSALTESRGIQSVTPDYKVFMQHTVDGFDASNDPGSMFNTARAIRATDVLRQGITGKGVDIALIDTGVAPVQGLTAAGTVVNGLDVSFEAPAEHLRHLDTNGHGTHLAGIITGRDSNSGYYTDHDSFTGIAPDSRLLNVKVANANGSTDVSQVLAAIDWVVQHRNDNGMNIRVLNLSFGTPGTQSYLEDPLTYAAEVAWRKGIVVVVAAGNSQFGDSKLNNPAYDPYVIAVGADDTKGSWVVSDDEIPAWSAKGDGTRNPDFVAPGKSIVSLRNPGSHVDLTHPEGRINARFFKGSGTSQAAAVVSGAAALLLQHRPNLTPDQVKYLLASTANPLPAADPVAQGAGLINVKNAVAAPTPSYVQSFPLATGTGSLDLARGPQGSQRIESAPNKKELRGEIDIFGNSWSGNSWSGNSWSGNSWSGGNWNGNSWSGNSWSGNSWSGNSWSSGNWSGNSWSGNSWSAGGWSGNSWSGNSWSGNSWSGNSWSGNSWSGNSWSGNSWSGNSWSGNSWSSAIWGD